MRYKGFTLIELLVVIAVIGMLASIVLVSLKDTRERGTIAKGESLYSQIAHVLGVEARGIWRFENNTKDESGNGNNGTIQGSLSYVAGIFQGSFALQFNQSASNYVSVADSSSLDIQDKITISAWVKPASKHWGTIVGKGYSCNDCIMVDVQTDGTWYIGRYNGGYSEAFSGGSYIVGAWSHIAVTVDTSLPSAERMKIYQNGTYIGARSFSAPVNNNNRVLGIGYNVSGDGRPFNGTIDEVAIYGAAFTAGEIQRLYAEGTKRYHVASVPGI
jgi:prepilin-type N-terminal cleavage/methylation domain-containing protein